MIPSLDPESCYTLHFEVKEESKLDDFFDKMDKFLFSLFNNFGWSCED
jgi:hypothetical protein